MLRCYIDCRRSRGSNCEFVSVAVGTAVATRNDKRTGMHGLTRGLVVIVLDADGTLIILFADSFGFDPEGKSSILDITTDLSKSICGVLTR